MLLVCFCKQKTAYEVRISDWSSDVCSSDLRESIFDRRLGELDGVADEIDLAVAAAAVGHGDLHVEGEHLWIGEDLVEGVHRPGRHRQLGKIGRASCRERVCPYV